MAPRKTTRKTTRKGTSRKTTRKPSLVKPSVVYALIAERKGIETAAAGKTTRAKLRRNFDDYNKRFDYPGDAKPERNDKRPWPDMPKALVKELAS
jgi:hypothetical protein